MKLTRHLSGFRKLLSSKNYTYLILFILAITFIYLYFTPWERNTSTFGFKRKYGVKFEPVSTSTISKAEKYFTIKSTSKFIKPTTELEDIIVSRNAISSRNNHLFSKQSSLDSSDSIASVSSDKKVSSILTMANAPAQLNEVFSVNISKPPKGFLVYSSNCKIPDIDPMDQSIRNLISFKKPLNCTTREPITKTNGNWLILDIEAAERRGFTNYSCCFKSISRYEAEDASVKDERFVYGDCHDLLDRARIQDEFVTVICRNSSGKKIYQEFHSFIHDKPKVEERCNTHKTPPYSVLILGIDSVSRLNAHRQLNRTVKYLLNNMNANEMFGFNKIGDNTLPNLSAILLGYDERELSRVCWNISAEETFDNCNFLWKSFAENGYRTLYAEDVPRISTFNYVKEGFYNQPTDYYFRPFILPYEDRLKWKKKGNCHLCVGSVSETEVALHWTQQFANHFKHKAYFSFTWINSVTHDNVNAASSVDYLYERFFKDLHQSGALNRTIVVVMGDHGMRWGRFRATSIGRLEERLPMLFIALPPSFRKQYQKETASLKINAHRLITPFDLYATFLNLLHVQEDWLFTNEDNVSKELAENFTNRARSLFQTMAENRSCADAFIDEHWCTCKAFISIDTASSDTLVDAIAEYLIKAINEMLNAAADVCAKLSLKSINNAIMQSPSIERTNIKDDGDIYTLTIETLPGDAIFEATVRTAQPDYKFELLGSISRLNLYGNQSACVNNANLKKYCFCS